jgi:hypothetical protein
MKWMLAMGIVWLVLFCAGFPVTMALILWANKSKLEEELVGNRERTCQLAQRPRSTLCCGGLGLGWLDEGSESRQMVYEGHASNATARVLPHHNERRHS